MLDKLNEMYDKEDKLLKQFKSLELEYMQLQEEKELLQTMIMFQSNKEHREKKYKMYR